MWSPAWEQVCDALSGVSGWHHCASPCCLKSSEHTGDCVGSDARTLSQLLSSIRTDAAAQWDIVAFGTMESEITSLRDLYYDKHCLMDAFGPHKQHLYAHLTVCPLLYLTLSTTFQIWLLKWGISVNYKRVAALSCSLWSLSYIYFLHPAYIFTSAENIPSELFREIFKRGRFRRGIMWICTAQGLLVWMFANWLH